MVHNQMTTVHDEDALLASQHLTMMHNQKACKQADSYYIGGDSNDSRADLYCPSAGSN